MHWLTLEVFTAELPATAWLRGWHDALVETALTGGAVYWDDHEHAWGVVLEFVFSDEFARDRFRAHPTVRAALDAAPDPVNGVLVYPHRGGGSGARVPRRPAPAPVAGAVEAPEPDAPQPPDVIAGAALGSAGGRAQTLRDRRGRVA